MQKIAAPSETAPRTAGCRTALALAGLAGALCTCSTVTDFTPDRYLERTEQLCSDGVDNDENGAMDCADASCRGFEFCREDGAERCADGRDNDADGLTDCADATCCSEEVCALWPGCGEQAPLACSDGIDNDADGLTDCADFSCSGPQCCTRPVPLIAETFRLVNPSCVPIDCAEQAASCCGGDLEQCNPLNPEMWLAWGQPVPRVTSGKLHVNQPCAQCPASGILSATSYQLSPGLELEASLDLSQDPAGMLAVGFVDASTQVTTLPETACGGLQHRLPMLAGVVLEGPQLQAELGSVLRQIPTGGPSTNEEPQRIRILVRQDGLLELQRNGKRLDVIAVRVQPPYRWVRVVVQGRSAHTTVDDLLLARRSGCLDPGTWVAGQAGPAPVFQGSQGAPAFDGAGASSPSVLFAESRYLMYYTGRATPQGEGQIGLTTSDDGVNWSVPGTAVTIHGEPSTDLSQPTVLQSSGGGYLMAYRAASAQKVVIALARSSDGLHWTREGAVLSPGSTGAWDAGDIGSPALAEFRNRLYLWYTGEAEGGGPAAIGLAMGQRDGAPFQRVASSPVLRPSDGERDAVDPWVLLQDDALHMWYVGHDLSGTAAVKYAVSEDGRNWVLFPENPVMAAEAPGLFGAGSYAGPSVLDRWGRQQMWYGATIPGGGPGIGHAVNPGVSY